MDKATGSNPVDPTPFFTILMFDFEKLEVYGVARELNRNVLAFIFKDTNIDAHIRDSWKKGSLATVLHLAEGVGRMTDADKRHYFTMARSAVYECVALLHLISDLGQIDANTYQDFYARYEQLSKMLLGMYRSKS